MPELYISWSEYHQKIEQLAAKIYQSQWHFNQIVCLARGGLRAGDLLSRIYQQPLAILAASSYGGKGERTRGNLKFARDLTMTAEKLGSRVLLADDLVDSGITLREAIPWLQQHYGDDIQEIRTAVIWYKAGSAIAPDYYVDYLPDSPWIHQPFERYDRMNLAELGVGRVRFINDVKS
jgi:hypothetical protein